MGRIILTGLFCVFLSHLGLSMDRDDESFNLRHRKKLSKLTSNELFNYALYNQIQLEHRIEQTRKSEEYFILGMKEFKARRYDNALDYLEMASEYALPQHENYDAEYTVGSIYEFMKNDYGQAEHWYSLAENHGDKEAAKAKKRVIQKKSSFFPYFY